MDGTAIVFVALTLVVLVKAIADGRRRFRHATAFQQLLMRTVYASFVPVFCVEIALGVDPAVGRWYAVAATAVQLAVAMWFRQVASAARVHLPFPAESLKAVRYAGWALLALGFQYALLAARPDGRLAFALIFGGTWFWAAGAAGAQLWALWKIADGRLPELE